MDNKSQIPHPQKFIENVALASLTTQQAALKVLDPMKVMQAIDEALEAKSEQFFQYKGRVKDTRTSTDHPTRLTAAKLARDSLDGIQEGANQPRTIEIYLKMKREHAELEAMAAELESGDVKRLEGDGE